MRIDVEDIRKATEEYRRLNNYNLSEVELYENGVKLEIDQETIDHWKFTGLGLSYFIDTEVYKNGMGEDDDSRIEESSD